VPFPDPASPVPIYHQIAEHIRARIAAGELSPGTALEPLREAARRFGVNLHTVRHAYTALAREGLVETRGALGTRVLGRGVTARSRRARDARRESLQAFLARTLQEARTHHGLDGQELSTALARQAEDSESAPDVCVVECSAWQCECHARELERRFAVVAREWSLERDAEPPARTVVSTYFHYNDVRRRWPRRLADVRFLTIRPGPELAKRLAQGSSRAEPRLLILERDAETAANVAADVSLLLEPGRFRLETVVAEDPAAFLAGVPDGALVLCAPRVWGGLANKLRAHPRVVEVRYRFDAHELEALGASLGWAPARASVGAAR
jgi:DNA-binding transcriptional regulator YhcF (GntR family)